MALYIKEPHTFSVAQILVSALNYTNIDIGILIYVCSVTQSMIRGRKYLNYNE